ncbi:MAG: FtsX-like permease family protein [Acidobacteria bacterium]|nr:FtsX-like permease family protein [Acidobacteriota bacterium]MCI0626198.1 FtsX-like permease family protein [Acidobacteriota bacterium]MCI0718031.1 FtsX-like permease family protein [Acidobacteriota bacterium]
MMFELFVALRYLKAKRKQAAISVITIISILGVTAGVMALIVALAISRGFREDLQSKLLRGTSHINILPVDVKEGIANYPALVSKIKTVKGIRSATPAIYSAVLISAARPDGIMLKGMAIENSDFPTDSFFDVRQGDIRDLVSPADDPVRDRITLGTEMAKKLGTFVGDFVSILSDEGTLSPVGNVPVPRKFKVVAIFSSGLAEFDSAWGFTSLASAQRLFGTGDLVSLIECQVSDIYQVKQISREILAVLGEGYAAKDWQEQYRSIFQALQLERLVMIITIGLIVLVAALNIIIVLIMMVMEKNRDIAVLMSMGATQKTIRRIFVLQGVIIGVFGSVLGSIAGSLVCWLCDKYQLIRLETDVYSISHVPFRSSFWDVLLVSAAAVTISFLATLYPSKNAAQLDPVVALRYE